MNSIEMYKYDIKHSTKIFIYHLWYLPFLSFLVLKKSLVGRDEEGFKVLEIDSSRTRFGGSKDFEEEGFPFLVLCLL